MIGGDAALSGQNFRSETAVAAEDAGQGSGAHPLFRHNALEHFESGNLGVVGGRGLVVIFHAIRVFPEI